MNETIIFVGGMIFGIILMLVINWNSNKDNKDNDNPYDGCQGGL